MRLSIVIILFFFAFVKYFFGMKKISLQSKDGAPTPNGFPLARPHAIIPPPAMENKKIARDYLKRNFQAINRPLRARTRSYSPPWKPKENSPASISKRNFQAINRKSPCAPARTLPRTPLLPRKRSVPHLKRRFLQRQFSSYKRLSPPKRHPTNEVSVRYVQRSACNTYLLLLLPFSSKIFYHIREEM